MNWPRVTPPGARLEALWSAVIALHCPRSDALERFLEDPFEVRPDQHLHILGGCAVCRRHLRRIALGVEPRRVHS